MKRTNQILILLIVIAIPFLQGCPQAESLGPVDGHYIERYIIPDSVKNSNFHYFDDMVSHQYLLFGEEFIGTLYEGVIYDGDQKVGGELSFDEIIERHQEVAERLGDTLYMEPATFSYHSPVFLDTITSIKVYSYPSLFSQDSTCMADSVFRIKYAMPYEFVQRGYKDEKAIYKSESLESFNMEVKPLMSSSFNLVLLEQPRLSGVYDFAVFVSFSNGKEFELNFTEVYLEGK